MTITQIITFLRTQGKGLSLLLTMAIGALLPQFHPFSFLIQYLIMVMLFFAFLDIEFKPQTFQKSVLLVLLANITVAFVSYAVLIPFDLTLALAAFMTAIAPTAIAAPVIIGFIQGKVEYVVASVLLTNIASALVVPIALPFLIGKEIQISVWQVLQPVLIVMFVPLILAQLAARLPTATQTVVRKGKALSFPIWLINLFLITSNASDFLRNGERDSALALFSIALVALVICIVNFGVGALLGGRSHWQEASQSLGQKNLSFVIWIALTFINPLVAMGPTFYILYHHLYNSWSIYRFERKTSNGQSQFWSNGPGRHGPHARPEYGAQRFQSGRL
jgi:BASS family bile acid:Na+ symporter